MSDPASLHRDEASLRHLGEHPLLPPRAGFTGRGEEPPPRGPATGSAVGLWRVDVLRRSDGGEDGAVDEPPPFRLEAIDQHNWRAAVAVRVAADQLRFVAGHEPVALVILAKAYVRAGDLDWEPLAVMSDASVVGVVALAHADRNTELLHLAIDVAKQGQGIGRAAVRLVLAHVAASRPGCQEVRLSVHPDNTRAQRLYRNVGFSPNGETRENEPVWSLPLNRR